MALSSDPDRGLTPPHPDELEVSVFGPGYGECVLVHLGANRWLLVDSCLDVQSREPAALAYLRQIGVDPATAVVQIVATHWHDDHIVGLAQTVQKCQVATLAISEALRPKEFMTLVSAYSRTGGWETGSGANEMATVFRELKRRAGGAGSVRFALADRRLWRGDSPAAEVWALSPSDRMCTDARLSFGRLLPKPGLAVGRLPDVTPNEASVVLWLRIGSASVLLGADLEEHGHQHSGWSGVLSSTTRPEGVATVFKVPHHGSHNADHPEVWRRMLAPEPVAVVTPFLRGGVALPTEEDRDRIQARTPNGFATGIVLNRVSTRRDPAVERTLNEVVRQRRPTCASSTGHVRVRMGTTPGSGTPEVLLRNGAFRLGATLGSRPGTRIR